LIILLVYSSGCINTNKENDKENYNTTITVSVQAWGSEDHHTVINIDDQTRGDNDEYNCDREEDHIFEPGEVAHIRFKVYRGLYRISLFDSNVSADYPGEGYDSIQLDLTGDYTVSVVWFTLYYDHIEASYPMGP
jgi:hypothetical protein